tara:strand:- start:439 stop:669 length:231 start_codon:yes stop_codon:yes gene_type:complete
MEALLMIISSIVGLILTVYIVLNNKLEEIDDKTIKLAILGSDVNKIIIKQFKLYNDEIERLETKIELLEIKTNNKG